MAEVHSAVATATAASNAGDPTVGESILLPISHSIRRSASCFGGQAFAQRGAHIRAAVTTLRSSNLPAFFNVAGLGLLLQTLYAILFFNRETQLTGRETAPSEMVRCDFEVFHFATHIFEGWIGIRTQIRFQGVFDARP